MKLRGKAVIVTGASSGIGRATAQEFARAGSNVVLASRDQKELEELAQELAGRPGRRLVVPVDVRDAQAVNAMVQRTVEEFGSVDVLVNNAAQGLDASVAEGKIENMRYVMDVNVFGAIYGVQAVVPHMKRQGSGCIVNVSSVESRIAVPFNGIYSATKAALTAITDALRMELEGTGIKVINVYPGLTVTAFHKNTIREVELPPRSRWLRGVPPSAAAKTIVQAVRREQREAFVTLGDAVAVAIKNVSPRLVEWGIRRLWLPSKDRPEVES